MVNGQPLQEDPKDQLVATWLILTKQEISIYDSFKQERHDLLWGPISRQYKTGRAICHEGRILTFTDESLFPQYIRGHIVGLTQGLEVEKHYKI